MKQQILNLKKKLLLVELPEYITEFTNHGKTIMVWEPDIRTRKCYGKLTDITEEQFAEWVKAGSYMRTFWNYLKNDNHKGNQLDTAKESFFSYLEKEGICFENPYGLKPVSDYYIEYGLTAKEAKEDSLRRSILITWEIAEKKLWIKDNCYIFVHFLK